MKEDPPFREVSVAVRPAAIHEMQWEEGRGQGSGSDSFLLFSLDKPRSVYAIRLIFSYDGAPGTRGTFRMFWRNSGRNHFTVAERNVRLSRRVPKEDLPGNRTTTVEVNDTIDQFRIYPDEQPFGLHLAEIVLLVPSADEPR
jgi:hypothetical protein